MVEVVRILPNGEAGPCRPRNEAIVGSALPWIFLLDSDAFPRPDCLEELLSALREHPEASLLTPRVLAGGGAEAPIEFDAGRCHFLGEMCLENRDLPPSRAQPPRPRPAAASATALLIRRDHALEAGLFDERLVFFREDMDFCFRLRAMGREIVHAPKALVEHRRGPRGPLHERRVFYQTRNRWWTMLKLFEARTLLLTLPLQVLYEALNLLLALREGRAVQFVRAFADLFLRLPEILAARGRFQAARRVPDRDILEAPPLAWRREVSSIGGAKMVKSSLDALCRLWRPVLK